MKTSYNVSTDFFNESPFPERPYVSAEIRDLQSIIRQLKAIVYHPETSEETRVVCSAAMIELTIYILALTETEIDSDDP